MDLQKNRSQSIGPVFLFAGTEQGHLTNEKKLLCTGKRFLIFNGESIMLKW
jgi:hypothetical protein